MKDLFYVFMKPEYIALSISIIAICINVYISYKNRKHLLAKEEYFKLQQVVEEIIAKLLILDNQRRRLRIYIELTYKASKSNNSLFIDSNDTFNREIFEKNGEKVTALIDIYFGDIKTQWNFCLDGMSDLYTHIFILSKDIENQSPINWEEKIKKFNELNLNLGDKPEKIADKLKQELGVFKKENL